MQSPFKLQMYALRSSSGGKGLKGRYGSRTSKDSTSPVLGTLHVDNAGSTGQDVQDFLVTDDVDCGGGRR